MVILESFKLWQHFFLLISLSYYGSFVFGFCVVAGCLTGILYKALLIIFPCSSCDIYHMIHKSELPPIFLSFNIKYLFIEKIPFNSSSSSSSSKIIKDDSRTRLTKTQWDLLIPKKHLQIPLHICKFDGPFIIFHANNSF